MKNCRSGLRDAEERARENGQLGFRDAEEGKKENCRPDFGEIGGSGKEERTYF